MICMTKVLVSNVVAQLDMRSPHDHFITVTGELVAVYTLTADGIQATISGTDLQINGGTASVNSTVQSSWDNGLRTNVIDTKWIGTTARGQDATRTGDYTTVVDPVDRCIAIDGDWETQVGGRAWDTTVSGFSKCAGECPADGGSIVWQAAGATLTVSYDGSATATWEHSNGSSGTIALPCL